jgi:TPR repeat protein
MQLLGAIMTDDGVNNRAEGVGWLRKAAERNHTWAMSLLGTALSGLKRDGVDGVPEGLLWYRRAAGLGSVLAMVNGGSILLHGFGVVRNVSAAAEWFERAALKGSDDGARNLVALLWGRLGRRIDTMEAPAVEALSWIRKGVAQGRAWAMRDMALAYQNGIGVLRKENSAL